MGLIATAPAFLDEFRAQLAARPALADAEVSTAPDPDPQLLKAIQFGNVAADEEPASMSPNLRRRETYKVEGLCWRLIEAGANEAARKAARDGVYALLNEVELALRADGTVGGTVHYAQLTHADLYQGVAPEGRWAQLHFTVTVIAYLSP